jgi:hypothetical protein
MKISTLWTSEPMTIGKHDWRIGVGIFRIGAGKERCTFYEWRGPRSHVWCAAIHWPTYNVNDGAHGGMPKTLRKLYERERDALRPILDGNFPTELTPEGEQTVIPGCEKNAAPGIRQLELFG